MNSAVATWELAWALLLALIMFLLAAGSRRTLAIGVLLVLIPFQTIETRFGSSSVLMAYVLAVVLLLNGGLRVRMLAALGLILLAYLISLSQASRVIIALHVFYLFQFFSCFAVFLLAYNFSRLVENERVVVNLLLLVNGLVLLYCALQVGAGPGANVSLFGIEALSTNANREIGDARLVGPFGNPGATAGYFTLMTLLCAMELMFARGARGWLVRSIIVLNLIGLVATGNRAAFVVLVATFPAFLFMLRREIGARKVVRYAVGGVAALVIASAVAVAFTDFNRMFDRLATVTENEGGVPGTREGTWPVAIDKIKNDPWLGEGPFYVYPEAAEKLGWPRADFDDYPHSLYLYLLRTVGLIGLSAVLWFFVQAWLLLYSAQKLESLDKYSTSILRVGMVLIPAFLLAQVTLEFPRPSTMDYAQFVFALVGLLVGVADRRGANLPASSPIAQTFQTDLTSEPSSIGIRASRLGAHRCE